MWPTCDHLIIHNHRTCVLFTTDQILVRTTHFYRSMHTKSESRYTHINTINNQNMDKNLLQLKQLDAPNL